MKSFLLRIRNIRGEMDYPTEAKTLAVLLMRNANAKRLATFYKTPKLFSATIARLESINFCLEQDEEAPGLRHCLGGEMEILIPMGGFDRPRALSLHVFARAFGQSSKRF